MSQAEEVREKLRLAVEREDWEAVLRLAREARDVGALPQPALVQVESAAQRALSISIMQDWETRGQEMNRIKEELARILKG